jgi:hypothetical protein
MNDYRTQFVVAAAPAKVFAAINDVRSWWTGDVEGVADAVGGEFTYRNGDLHFSRQRVAELAAGKRVVWDIVEARLSFVTRQDGWTGTRIAFEISPADAGAELRFAHLGLTPDCECYKACSGGWAYFIDGSLRQLIETGRGYPPLA